MGEGRGGERGAGGYTFIVFIDIQHVADEGQDILRGVGSCQRGGQVEKEHGVPVALLRNDGATLTFILSAPIQRVVAFRYQHSGGSQ